MADWSAVYLRDRLSTDAAFAAAGYAAFSVAMAVMICKPVGEKSLRSGLSFKMGSTAIFPPERPVALF